MPAGAEELEDPRTSYPSRIPTPCSPPVELWAMISNQVTSRSVEVLPEAPPEHVVGSLQEYVGFLEQLLDVDDRPRWFRGVGQSSFPLQPGLFRISTRTPPQHFEMERKLFQQFKLRSRPYLPNNPGDDWELLFVMQHHRMPTRLLDWTENALVALYFALESANRAPHPGDAAVWCLDPVGWNDHTFARANPPNSVLTVDENRLTYYRSPPDIELLREPPVAIYAPHNNPRIVAQSGTFTIFGSSTVGMEELWRSAGYPAQSLVKIIISQAHSEAMLSKLTRAGYTHSKIFPDLDGLAVELRRLTGFDGNV